MEHERAWIIAQNTLCVVCLALGPLLGKRALNLPAALLAAALILVGAVIGIWAVKSLGRNRTPNPTPLPGADLVQTGIYARIQHPLYASLMLVTLGWSIGWRSAPALLASAALAVLLDRKARLEERLLSQRFESHYAYSQRVARFVPGVY